MHSVRTKTQTFILFMVSLSCSSWWADDKASSCMSVIFMSFSCSLCCSSTTAFSVSSHNLHNSHKCQIRNSPKSTFSLFTIWPSIKLYLFCTEWELILAGNRQNILHSLLIIGGFLVKQKTYAVEECECFSPPLAARLCGCSSGELGTDASDISVSGSTSLTDPCLFFGLRLNALLNELLNWNKITDIQKAHQNNHILIQSTAPKLAPKSKFTPKVHEISALHV